MSAIVFNDVWKSFPFGLKKNVVLHGLTLTVEHGEIYGFLGPNGAGKSTSIKLLLDFIHPDRGTIEVNGRLVGDAEYKQFIGYLPETPCFYENLTSLETLRFVGRASGMSPNSLETRAREILQRLKLWHAANNRIKTYSKGMKQRLGLAVSLIHDPDIYILDEPMSGLDPMGRRLITEVILELGQAGKTVFFSSHILSDIERLCDNIGIINRGKLLYSGPVAEFMKGETYLEDAFVKAMTEDLGN